MDDQLKELLARELCAIVGGRTQDEAAALLRLHQSELSRLRNNQLERFSLARLVRLITARGYHMEVHLRPIRRRFAKPRPQPKVSVVRYDSHDRVIG